MSSDDKAMLGFAAIAVVALALALLWTLSDSDTHSPSYSQLLAGAAKDGSKASPRRERALPCCSAACPSRVA